MNIQCNGCCWGGNGKVGAGLGSAAIPDAVKRTIYAEKNMNNITLNGPTIPHEITTKFSGSKVYNHLHLEQE